MGILFFVVVLCIIVTPGLLENYRSILGITEKEFTHYESIETVNKYSVSFVTKLSLVTGMYIIKILILLIPALFIIKLSQNNNNTSKFISFLVCFIPLLFVDGTIAKSLIYVIILLIHRSACMKDNKNFWKTMFLLLLLGGIAVIAYWIIRYSVNNVGSNQSVFSYFSKTFSAYFSGVNIVSGSFNLPTALEYKIRYFAYGFIKSIPYGNTIFNPKYEALQTFFNSYNKTYGQIPTTIGMGYYYFGMIFAPIYSCVFALFSCKAGDELNKKTDFLYQIRLLLIIFTFSMGIIMYNIEITFTSVFTTIVPLWILEKLNNNVLENKK